MSIGEVVGIVKRSISSWEWYCGVGGCRESAEDVSESKSGEPSSASIKVTIEADSGMAA